MGLFRQSQADKLAGMRRDVDEGKVSEEKLAAEVRKSTAQELDDAMRQYGGYEEWGH